MKQLFVRIEHPDTSIVVDPAAESLRQSIRYLGVERYTDMIEDQDSILSSIQNTIDTFSKEISAVEIEFPEPEPQPTQDAASRPGEDRGDDSGGSGLSSSRSSVSVTPSQADESIGSPVNSGSSSSLKSSGTDNVAPEKKKKKTKKETTKKAKKTRKADMKGIGEDDQEKETSHSLRKDETVPTASRDKSDGDVSAEATSSKKATTKKKKKKKKKKKAATKKAAKKSTKKKADDESQVEADPSDSAGLTDGQDSGTNHETTPGRVAYDHQLGDRHANEKLLGRQVSGELAGRVPDNADGFSGEDGKAGGHSETSKDRARVGRSLGQSETEAGVLKGALSRETSSKRTETSGSPYEAGAFVETETAHTGGNSLTGESLEPSDSSDTATAHDSTGAHDSHDASGEEDAPVRLSLSDDAGTPWSSETSWSSGNTPSPGGTQAPETQNSPETSQSPEASQALDSAQSPGTSWASGTSQSLEKESTSSPSQATDRAEARESAGGTLTSSGSGDPESGVDQDVTPPKPPTPRVVSSSSGGADDDNMASEGGAIPSAQGDMKADDADRTTEIEQKEVPESRDAAATADVVTPDTTGEMVEGQGYDGEGVAANDTPGSVSGTMEEDVSGRGAGHQEQDNHSVDLEQNTGAQSGEDDDLWKGEPHMDFTSDGLTLPDPPAGYNNTRVWELIAGTGAGIVLGLAFALMFFM